MSVSMMYGVWSRFVVENFVGGLDFHPDPARMAALLQYMCGIACGQDGQ